MSRQLLGGSFESHRMLGHQASTGDVTVRGQTADIDMSFWDLFDSGSSGAELDSLAALMGYVEAQNGRWGIYGDVVWGKFDFSDGVVTQRNPIANLKVSARANAGLGCEITMAESGLTYEVARWAGASSSTALDLLGGARYWNQDLNLSLAVDASVDLGKLGLESRVHAPSRVPARSNGSTPSSGLRVRHELAPGRSFNSSATSAALVSAAILLGSCLLATALIFRFGNQRCMASSAIAHCCRFHPGQRIQQKQPRPNPPRPGRWIELPVVDAIPTTYLFNPGILGANDISTACPRKQP